MNNTKTALSYDYSGLLASTWDIWRDNTGNWSDRFFYLDIVRQYGQPVLDVGCGTGRIILDYLTEGIDIDGVDNSPEMLAVCRAKADKLGLAPNLYQQSIETLALPRTYRTILAPSSTLQLIVDVEAVRTTLKHFYDHLRPGGAFVASFAFAWREGEPLETDWRLQFEKPRLEDGAIVRSWVREWHEPAAQLWHAEQRFEVTLNGEVIATEFHRRSPEGRSYTQSQALQLYQEAGFTDIQLFHEFEHVPARESDWLFCVLGEKPTSAMSAASHIEAGESQLHAGQYAQAQAAFESALALNPNCAPALDWLGVIYIHQKRYEDVIVLYQRLISIEEAHSPHRIMGMVYDHLGNRDLAIAHLERAIALKSQDYEARAALAKVYRAAGRHVEADAQDALADAMAVQDEEYGQACVQALRGNVDAAIALLKVALPKGLVMPGWARIDPEFAFIRDDQRFKALVGE